MWISWLLLRDCGWRSITTQILGWYVMDSFIWARQTRGSGARWREDTFSQALITSHHFFLKCVISLENWNLSHGLTSGNGGQSSALFLSHWHAHWYAHANYSFTTWEGFRRFYPLRRVFTPLSFWDQITAIRVRFWVLFDLRRRSRMHLHDCFANFPSSPTLLHGYAPSTGLLYLPTSHVACLQSPKMNRHPPKAHIAPLHCTTLHLIGPNISQKYKIIPQGFYLFWLRWWNELLLDMNSWVTGRL